MKQLLCKFLIGYLFSVTVNAAHLPKAFSSTLLQTGDSFEAVMKQFDKLQEEPVVHDDFKAWHKRTVAAHLMLAKFYNSHHLQ